MEMNTHSYRWTYSAFVLIFLVWISLLALHRDDAPRIPDAQAVNQDTEKEQPADMTLSVQIKPLPEPEEAPQTESAPVMTARPEQREDAVSDQADEGTVLPISADYRTHLGFRGYVREMARVGGVFYLLKNDDEEILAEVDLLERTFKPVDMQRLRNMSPRVREVTNEIAVTRLIHDARNVHGAYRYSIILLLPRSLDNRIQQEILAALRLAGIDPSTVGRLRGEYRHSENRVTLQINEAVFNDGRTAPLRIPLAI